MNEEKFSKYLKPQLEVFGIKIIILSRLNLHLSIFKQFVKNWREIIYEKEVRKIDKNNSQSDSICLICNQNQANITSIKCRCQTIYCNGCLANWFITNIPGNVEPQDWLLQKGTCPVCRQNYGVDDLRVTQYN